MVESGLTITGVPLKDQAEARNLSDALDFFEEIAGSANTPISEIDIRQIHALVLSGISEEAGKYRSVSVQISDSEYSPPGPESVSAEMAEFGLWLATASMPEEESFAGVSGMLAAAVAHTWFVTIHPFIDGNGRVSRLLLNLLLMRYGFPIAIISKEDRIRYYDALEQSQASDLTPFIMLLTECISESLEEYEAAAKEMEIREEWTRTLAEKYSKSERLRAENEYEVWKNAMEFLKSSLCDIVDSLNEKTGHGAKLFLRILEILGLRGTMHYVQENQPSGLGFCALIFGRGTRLLPGICFFSARQASRCEDDNVRSRSISHVKSHWIHTTMSDLKTWGRTTQWILLKLVMPSRMNAL